MFKKCEFCGSIWVCWNAWRGTYGDKGSKSRGDDIHFWGWTCECWDCSGGKTYPKKVRTGIPYFLLIRFYNLFHADKHASDKFQSVYLLRHIHKLLVDDETIKFPEYDENHKDKDHKKWLLDQIKDFLKHEIGGWG